MEKYQFSTFQPPPIGLQAQKTKKNSKFPKLKKFSIGPKPAPGPPRAQIWYLQVTPTHVLPFDKLSSNSQFLPCYNLVQAIKKASLKIVTLLLKHVAQQQDKDIDKHAI